MPNAKIYRRPDGVWVGVCMVGGRPIYATCNEHDVYNQLRSELPHGAAVGNVFKDLKKTARKVAKGKVVKQLGKAWKTIKTNPAIRAAISAVPGGGAVLEGMNSVEHGAKVAKKIGHGDFQGAMDMAQKDPRVAAYLKQNPSLNRVLKAGAITQQASHLIERSRKGDHEATKGIQAVADAARAGDPAAERSMRVMRVVADAHGEIRRDEGTKGGRRPVNPPESDGFIDFDSQSSSPSLFGEGIARMARR